MTEWSKWHVDYSAALEQSDEYWKSLRASAEVRDA